MSFKYYNERTGQYEVLTVPTLKGERGEPGAPGAKGEAGVTPNLTIGTVITLEPEREASVAIRGTKENPILDISIPRGGRGEKGIFVGSKEDAPLSAEIVIDHSDEGSFVGGSIEEELVEVPIVDGVLTLTTDKYQTTTMENNITIELPSVDKFTEIRLFFNATRTLTLTLPSIKWQAEPTVEANKMYEFIFTYTTEWLGGSVVYTSSLPPEKPITDGLICWLDGRDGKGTDTIWKDRSGNGNDASLLCDFDPLYHEWDGKKFVVKNSTDKFKTGFKNTLRDYKTLEFNFTINDHKYYPYLFSSMNRKTRMLLQNSNALHYTPSNDGVLKGYGNYIFSFKTPYVVTITLGAEISIYINGVKRITDRHIGTPEDGIFYIFCDQHDSDLNARQLVGHCYSFKAYNRILTEEEIKQNYDYEQSINRG